MPPSSAPVRPPAPPWRWPLWGAVALAAVSLAGYLAMAAARSDTMWWMGDLKVYRAGGKAVLAGDASLYDITVSLANLPFTYTPWAAVVFVPLTWLPLAVLKCLAVAVNISLLFICAYLAWGMAGRFEKHRTALALATSAVLLWSDPVQETLRFGQVNLGLLALVLFDLSRRGPRTKFQGVGVGLAAALKLTPLIFVAYLFLTRRYRAGFTALGTFAGTIALAFALLPKESGRYWGGVFGDDTRMGFAPFPGNQSLRGTLARVLHEGAPPTLLWFLASGLVGCLGLAAAAVLSRKGHDLAGISLCALVGLLVSPISWTHHWVWIIPGLVVLITFARGSAHKAAWLLPAALVAVMAALPVQRGELHQSIPTGVVWRVPYRQGRELDLRGFEQVTASAYTLAGLLLLLGVSLVVLASAAKAHRSARPQETRPEETRPEKSRPEEPHPAPTLPAPPRSGGPITWRSAPAGTKTS
jgi:alpha-1,2-mannosyltransferase